MKAGTVIIPGVDFTGECDIYAVKDLLMGQDYRDKGCIGFPSHPYSTPTQCSYVWVVKTP